MRRLRRQRLRRLSRLSRLPWMQRLRLRRLRRRLVGRLRRLWRRDLLGMDPVGLGLGLLTESLRVAKLPRPPVPLRALACPGTVAIAA